MRFSILTLGDNYAELRSHERFYHEVIEEAEHAEELGYEGFWVGEHHFQPSYRVFPSPQMVLAAISQCTRRIRLGTGVNVLPINDPIRLAEDLAELDLLSHGRMCLGAGRGYQPHEFAGFHVPMESARERFWECLEIIRRAWTEEQFSYTGKYYRYEQIALLPRPVQIPAPPIFVAAASQGSAEEAGRRGYPFACAQFSAAPTPEQVASQIDRFNQSYVAAGHGQPPDDLPHVFWTHVADSTTQALHEAEAGMKRKLGSSTRQWVKAGVSGYEAFAKLGQFLASATIEQLDALSIFGDPPRCVDKIGQYAAVGLNHLMVMFDWGGMPQKTILHSMELFAKYVMPYFVDAEETSQIAAQAK
ncbi:MAG: LLM class flavin-dependent oxidoreductase [Deltaproteobacteria bacterium]|nr:LLM class flavin-dependent oxidoreductase [Deltaproteobacteria bacterium]